MQLLAALVAGGNDLEIGVVELSLAASGAAAAKATLE
jgi:hypothetical protein